MGTLYLQGGPLDGGVYERSARPPNFVWIDADGKCWSTGQACRVLYRLATSQNRRPDGAPSGIWPRWYFEYAQLLVTQCPGCDWFVPRVERKCPICATRVR